VKRLLIPLLAALALPTAVNAESHWLVLTYGSNSGSSSASLEKIEMPSAEFCEKKEDVGKIVLLMELIKRKENSIV
tara:strand:- start:261 stop:488 length:228 start_codon:yes stop_codon:yes gene_type:complete